MLKLKSILIIILCACLLSGCGLGNVEFSAHGGDTEINELLPTQEPLETDVWQDDQLQAWMDEIAADSALLQQQLEEMLLSTLHNAQGERIVPYIGDIYYHGDCTLLNYSYGLASVGGKIITDDCFCCVWTVLDRANSNEQVYLCHSSNDETLAQCWAVVSAKGEFLGWVDEMWENGELNSRWIDCSSNTDSFVYVGYKDAGTGSVVDDGVYHIDVEYAESDDRDWIHLDFTDFGDGCFDICRNSDGEKVGTTEMLNEWTEPDLYPYDSHEGRMYCTVEDGCLVMRDKSFKPLVRVHRAGTAPIEEAPAEEATAAAEPAEAGDGLSERERCNLNLFLSNFSEQDFGREGGQFNIEYASICDSELLRFAYLWCEINKPELISYNNNEAIISREAVEQVIKDKFAPPGDASEPMDGFICCIESADGSKWNGGLEGENYIFDAVDIRGNRFSVVDTLEIVDGRLYVHFSVYELDRSIYDAAKAVPSDYYFMTAQRAPDFVNAGKISLSGKGLAVCDFEHSAEGELREFRLVEYRIYE